MISPAMKNSFFGAVRVFLCVCLFLLPYIPPIFADVFGDVSDNDAEDIADAIISLRVASGLSVEGDIPPAADVDDDQKIGLAEAIYVLQRIAGLRLPLFCLSTEESELARLLNEYRKENSLSELTLSKSLSYVARVHVRDLQDHHPDDGDCSMHSWSDQGDWSAVCDVGTAETWALTQAKPREITEGIYAEDGFEVVYSCSEMDAQAALDKWKESPAHSAVILQRDAWSVKDWGVMGVGIHESYAAVWFGEGQDAAGAAASCE